MIGMQSAARGAVILNRRGLYALLAALFVIASAAAPRPALSADPGMTKNELYTLVEDARLSLERLMTAPEGENFKRYLSQARGVLIIPELVKGGLIVGAEGGSGVLLVRGTDGTWSAPAFYTLAAGSIGLQIGVQVSEVAFTVMTESAIESLLGSEFKLGADVSVAVGPIGAGVEASSTTNIRADIYAFSRAAGLFGGGALKGAKIFSRKEWNNTYYGAPAPARAVVIERKFFNPQADKLRKTLATSP